MNLPAFDDLPQIEALKLRHSWGRFENENLGTLNLITQETRLSALKSARTGEVVNLTLPLSEPSPPLYNRPSYQHEIFASGRNSNDDYLDRFYLQGSTQCDGLRHIRCREFGFYGGVDEDFQPGPGKLGMEHFAGTGIISRGVLLDLPRHCAHTGRDYDPFSGEAITEDLLSEVAQAQEVVIEPGDVLCVNFGWARKYFGLPEAERAESPGRKKFAGLAGSEGVAAYLWNNQVAALVCDNPAVEVSPGDPAVGSLHRRTIPTLGLVLGELFDFRELAEACVRRGRQDFLFTSVPINVPGAIGSPGNAVAVL